MIDRVAPRAQQCGCKIVTLHDAIFAPVIGSLDAVEQSFAGALHEIGFSLSLKREVA